MLLGIEDDASVSRSESLSDTGCQPRGTMDIITWTSLGKKSFADR